MSLNDIEYASNRVPVFSGLQDDWAQWSELMLARAARRGYYHLLTDDTVLIPVTPVRKRGV